MIVVRFVCILYTPLCVLIDKKNQMRKSLLFACLTDWLTEWLEMDESCNVYTKKKKTEGKRKIVENYLEYWYVFVHFTNLTLTKKKWFMNKFLKRFSQSFKSWKKKWLTRWKNNCNYVVYAMCNVHAVNGRKEWKTGDDKINKWHNFNLN